MKKTVFIFLLTLVTTLAVAQTDTDSTEEEFLLVQAEAEFPGGLTAWRKYLEKNLNTSLSKKCLKLRKGQKRITQTVVVAFSVDKEGNVSDVKAENATSVCSLFVEEAIRVISTGPKWIPGQQNGRKIISRKKQSITWVLED